MITRREFLEKSVLATGGLAAAKLLVDPLAPGISHAAQVDANDPALTSSEIKYASTDGTAIGGYVTRPKADIPRPAILVAIVILPLSPATATIGFRQEPCAGNWPRQPALPKSRCR